MENRINTTSETAINSTLQIGQRIRNGNNRWFQIAGLSETQIALRALNGETEKITQFSRRVFVQLYYRKNYDQLTTSNPTREAIEAHRTGANRFIIK